MVFTHAFIGVPITNFILKNTKKKFKKIETKMIWVVGIVSAVLPDFDLIYVLFNRELKHRYFVSHSIVPYTVIFLIVFLILMFMKKHRDLARTILYVFFFGVLSHLIIDMLVGGIVLFAPYSYGIYGREMFGNASSNTLWILRYVFSFYMVIEILSVLPYYYIQRKVKNDVVTYLPLFLFGCSFFAFLFFIFF